MAGGRGRPAGRPARRRRGRPGRGRRPGRDPHRRAGQAAQGGRVRGGRDGPLAGVLRPGWTCPARSSRTTSRATRNWCTARSAWSRRSRRGTTRCCWPAGSWGPRCWPATPWCSSRAGQAAGRTPTSRCSRRPLWLQYFAGPGDAAARSSRTTSSGYVEVVAAAARRGGRHHAVELPADPGLLEDRARRCWRATRWCSSRRRSRRCPPWRWASILRRVLPPGVLNVVSGGDELGAWMTDPPGRREDQLHRVGARPARRSPPRPRPTSSGSPSNWAATTRRSCSTTPTRRPWTGACSGRVHQQRPDLRGYQAGLRAGERCTTTWSRRSPHRARRVRVGDGTEPGRPARPDPEPAAVRPGQGAGRRRAGPRRDGGGGRRTRWTGPATSSRPPS